MPQTVLQVVQEFCGKKTLPVPTSVIGNTDFGVVQIRHLLAEVVRELSEYRWEEQKVEKTWISVATQSQGSFVSIFGAGFKSIIQGTIWDQTLGKPILGPASDNSWANAQGSEFTGVDSYWKALGGNLHILPIPTAGNTLYAIYESSYAVADSNGTSKAAVTVDTDYFLLPELLVHKALDWKWKKQKGEAWETDYAEFSAYLPKKLTDKGMPVLQLDGESSGITPGIWVPAGSWPV